MGTYVARKMFEHQFSSYFIYEYNKRFGTPEYKIEGNHNLYFIVADQLMLDDTDLEEMLSYVYRGNRLFISASYLDERLMDTLSVKNKFNGDIPPAIFGLYNADTMRYTSLQFSDTTLPGMKQFGFYYFPLLDHFTWYDSTKVTVLGLNELQKPDFIAVKYGNGIVFLHLHPEAFSNYFLLNGKNHEYFSKVASYMNSDRESVYWDDYYRRGLYPENKFSSLGIFLKYPSLKWALFLSIGGLLLYVLMGLKRRQRIVPVIQPNTNSSVTFAETIGRLYLQKKDHHNIAHKMVTYFLEKVRTTFFLSTSAINAEFISSLSRKSGVTETEVKSTFQYIQQLQESERISDAELLELHNRLLQFFKHSDYGK